MINDKPIAVFDSGVGGLTVLKSLKDRLPKQNFIYLGDSARLPYGSKTPQTIRKYAVQCLSFLSQFEPQAYIVACNSASTQIAESEWLGKPLLTVIEPVVKVASQVTKTHHIGVIGTRATINSKLFSKLLKVLNPDEHVFEQSCPLFVPLAEEGWVDDPITNLIAYRYISPMMQNPIDTLILGCTHYPLLKSSIQKASGAGVNLIEAGPTLANEIEHLILNQKIDPTQDGNLRIFLSDRTSQSDFWTKSLMGLDLDFEIESADL